MITRIALTAAVVLAFFGAGVASAHADPNPTDTRANLFAQLTPEGPGVPPPHGPDVQTEIERGLLTALSPRTHRPQQE